MDSDERCNTSVAHTIVLDSTSLIVRNARVGAKIALQVTPDRGYIVDVDAAEIEMHVRLDRTE